MIRTPTSAAGQQTLTALLFKWARTIPKYPLESMSNSCPENLQRQLRALGYFTGLGQEKKKNDHHSFAF